MKNPSAIGYHLLNYPNTSNILMTTYLQFQRKDVTYHLSFLESLFIKKNF